VSGSVEVKRRTLVVHAGGIGDFLLTCPALLQLAEQGPLDLAGRPERLRLALAAGIVEAVHDLEDIDFYTLFSQPSARLGDFLRSYTRVIVWMRDDGALRDALQRAGAPEVEVFPGLPPPEWARHASEYYLNCLGMEARPFQLAVTPAGEPLDVIIHPGSGSAAKNWPLHHFEKVAARLMQHGRHVTWCRGPAEESRLESPQADALQETELTALASRLAAAQLYIGNDSGITHLAAAVGCPTLAVFGPTDPTIWAPKGAHVTVVAGKPWPSDEDVLEAFSFPL
jgi:hypothetical protein